MSVTPMRNFRAALHGLIHQNPVGNPLHDFTVNLLGIVQKHINGIYFINQILFGRPPISGAVGFG